MSGQEVYLVYNASFQSREEWERGEINFESQKWDREKFSNIEAAMERLKFCIEYGRSPFIIPVSTTAAVRILSVCLPRFQGNVSPIDAQRQQPLRQAGCC